MMKQQLLRLDAVGLLEENCCYSTICLVLFLVTHRGPTARFMLAGLAGDDDDGAYI